MNTRTEEPEEKALVLITKFKTILDDFINTMDIGFYDYEGEYRYKNQTDKKLATACAEMMLRELCKINAENKYTITTVENKNILIIEKDKFDYWEEVMEKIKSINIDDLIWPNKKEDEKTMERRHKEIEELVKKQELDRIKFRE